MPSKPSPLGPAYHRDPVSQPWFSQFPRIEKSLEVRVLGEVLGGKGYSPASLLGPHQKILLKSSTLFQFAKIFKLSLIASSASLQEGWGKVFESESYNQTSQPQATIQCWSSQVQSINPQASTRPGFLLSPRSLLLTPWPEMPQSQFSCPPEIARLQGGHLSRPLPYSGLTHPSSYPTCKENMKSDIGTPKESQAHCEVRGVGRTCTPSSCLPAPLPCVS